MAGRDVGIRGGADPRGGFPDLSPAPSLNSGWARAQGLRPWSFQLPALLFEFRTPRSERRASASEFLAPALEPLTAMLECRALSFELGAPVFERKALPLELWASDSESQAWALKLGARNLT